MDELGFASDSSVQALVRWIQARLDTPDSFRHGYQSKMPIRTWTCGSLYDAFTRYRWPFGTVHPVTGRTIRGESFTQTKDLLDELTGILTESISRDEAELCRETCFAILQWGGVLNKNQAYLEQRADKLPGDLRSVQAIRLDKIRTHALPVMRMSSGMVKMYSLLVEDLVMYDSRVAAALCLLVRHYCVEAGLDAVPPLLRFRLLPARSAAHRDPSDDRYKFPALTGINEHLRWQQYLESVVRASWLLKSVVRTCPSSFSKLGRGDDLQALQSALFMVGYEVGQTGQRPAQPMHGSLTRRQRDVQLQAGDSVQKPSAHVSASLASLPSNLLDQVVRRIGPLPLRFRGIRIERDLIRVTLEVLNSAPGRVLAQNSRNDIAARTPDGLDRRVKEAMKTDLRTANITSDLLGEAGVVEVTQVINEATGRRVKATRLRDEWSW